MSGKTGYKVTMNFPAPNKFSPETQQGRDFLGQQSIIQSMTYECLPSFTNATIKLRHYSFWAWAFKILKKNFKNIKQEDQLPYLWKLETALIIANRMRDPDYKGMPGVLGVDFPDVDSPDTYEVPIFFDKKNRASSYEPVQYSPSIGTLNIVKRDGHDYQILKYGIKLGALFDETISKCEGYKELIDPKQKTLSVKHLKCLGEALSLENISKTEEDIFLEIIEQDELNRGQENGLTKRIQTTCMLLEIIQKHDITNTENILSPLWNVNYKCNKKLVSITSAWQIIRARQFFHLSVESFLSSFCLYLEIHESRTGNIKDYCKRFIEDIPSRSIGKIHLKEIQDLIARNATFKELTEFLYEICVENEINEETIMGLIVKLKLVVSKAYVFNNTFQFALLGLTLQILLNKRYPELQKLSGKMAEKFFKVPRNYRLSFVRIQNIFEKVMNKKIDAALEILFMEFMLKLHLGVSQDKWIQTGNFTFRFVRDENGGYRMQHNVGIKAPNTTGNKLSAYLSLLKYAGFWELDPNKKMVLTSSGSAYLKSQFE
ncbi:MAG: hypothetical protein HQK83_05830 [Fibrobacteria bacterium]|nr:hypothetical protein [Fibrobacteria bacterium]